MNDYDKANKILETLPLSDSDKKALEDYTSAGYNDINVALRTNAVSQQEIAQRIADLDTALDKLPNWTGGEVTRGLELSPEQVNMFLQNYQKGKTVTFPAYLSTSLDPDYGTPGGRASVSFIIRSRQGKALFDLSWAPFEQEVLFKRGSSFKVQSIQQNKQPPVIILTDP